MIAGLICLVLVLSALNVATLMDAGAHTRAYGVLASVLTGLGVDDWLRNSPTETRKRELASATQQLQARYRQLETVTLALVASTNALIVSHDALKIAHRKVKDAARAVSRRIGSRAAKGTARRLAVLPGETIPVIGNALIWGLTALDIKATCDDMKDAVALERSLEEGATLDERSVCGVRLPSVDEINAWIAQDWSAAYKSAADVLNGDGTEVVAPIPPPVDRGYLRNTYCRIFGC